MPPRRLLLCLLLAACPEAVAQTTEPAPEPVLEPIAEPVPEPAPDTPPEQEKPSPYTPEVPVEALSELTDPVTENLGSQVFFDANRPAFSRDGKKQVLEGDVVVIGGGALVAADHVLLDRTTNLVEARGRLVILSKNQLFLGDSVVYHLATGDFEIRDAVMLTNDTVEIEKVTRRIFGFTPAEVEFEKSRRRRLAEIEELKSRLRREARRQTNAGRPLENDLVNRYTLLLEQEALVKGQENPSLARFPSERRESLKRRREFWEKSKKTAVGGAPTGALSSSYFHLEGEQITRSNGNDYAARNALFTPCRCEEGESPAWAFRSDEIEAQVGGYADLAHPVLEIKGLPVLYLPYLKIPIKDRRQSGFLLPTFAEEPRSGKIYSQPVYFDLGPSADATFTTDVFEKRGTRLGMEYRTQMKEYSGWEVKVEGIRDRLWMEDRGVREELGGMYRDGLEYARDPANPDPGPPGEGVTGKADTEQWLRSRQFWNDNLASRADIKARNKTLDNEAMGDRLEQDINQHLAVPENTWRGGYSWRGVTYLAPRLSLVSNGEVQSDHRYSEELHIPDGFQEALLGSRAVKPFSTANAQMHLDGKDFYAGLGTRFGDNYLLDERFQGQQEPVRFKVQSRYYPLVPPGSPLPVYGQLTGDTIRITEFKARSDDEETSIAASPSLGDGNWKRMKLDTVTPVVSEKIIQVNQFNSLEARYIDHAGLDEPRSEIRSWKAGIEFRLPIDGKGDAPAWLAGEDCDVDNPPPECIDPDDPDAPKRLVHHIMDWRLRFSTRPTVVRRGPYYDLNGDEPELGTLSYFSSDVPAPKNADLAANDADVPDEERMQRHRRVTLFTDHVWKLMRRGWEKVPGKKPPEDKTQAAVDPSERARRELLYEVDRPVLDAGDLYDEANKKWLIDRYQLEDDYYATPFTFRSDVAYDFLDAQERERLRKENAEAPSDAQQDLPQAWKPVNAELGIHHKGFSLVSYTSYDVYFKLSRRLGHTLTLPTVLKSNLQLGYFVDGVYKSQTREVVRTYTRSATLVTSLIPPVQSFVKVKRQDKPDDPAFDETYSNRFETAAGFKYDSPSQCWGLQFSREKKYTYDEREASYVLQLNVVFMGQTRPLPNMSPGVVRETTSQDQPPDNT